MTPFDGMKGLTRNPLGILAIFLGVLYGIAGLLLGVDTLPLSQANQDRLTWLVLIFPFVSLGVFGWLVSKHHTKLYAPHDYRSDEGFFGSFQPTTTAEAHQKLIDEAAAADEVEEAAASAEAAVVDDAPKPDNSDVVGDLAASSSENARKDRMSSIAVNADRRRQIYLCESLIMDILQKEFPSLQRQVKFVSKSGRAVLLDAVVPSAQQIILIEVMAAQFEHTIAMRSRDIAFSLASIRAEVAPVDRVRVMVCVVWLAGQPQSASRAIERARQAFADMDFTNVEIRQFVLVGSDSAGLPQLEMVG